MIAEDPKTTLLAARMGGGGEKGGMGGMGGIDYWSKLESAFLADPNQHVKIAVVLHAHSRRHHLQR
jgi:hypothetical protein